MLGMTLEYPRATAEKKIIPFRRHGIEIMSTAFFTEPGNPVIWRGPMLHQMLENFFYQVAWNKNLDFMIIDAPPGTGDVTIDLKNIVPTAEAIIVTTPHLAASDVATKAGIAVRKLKQSIIGVVENMAYYENPSTGEKEYIFGRGGGEAVAENLIASHRANPHPAAEKHLALYEPEEENGKKFIELASYVIAFES